MSTQIDGSDGDENTQESDWRELRHEFDANEDHKTDDYQENGAVEADVVVENVFVGLEVAEQRELWTQVIEQNLDGARDVHLGDNHVIRGQRAEKRSTNRSGDRSAEKEENSDGAAELGAQRARYHEVGAPGGDDAIGGDGRQRYRLKETIEVNSD